MRRYHIVWIPKYRYKILTGSVAKEAEHCICAFPEQQPYGEVIELNVQVAPSTFDGEHTEVCKILEKEGASNFSE